MKNKDENKLIVLHLILISPFIYLVYFKNILIVLFR